MAAWRPGKAAAAGRPPENRLSVSAATLPEGDSAVTVPAGPSVTGPTVSGAGRLVLPGPAARSAAIGPTGGMVTVGGDWPAVAGHAGSSGAVLSRSGVAASAATARGTGGAATIAPQAGQKREPTVLRWPLPQRSRTS